MEDKKVCKHCGETISKKAKICPHCRKKQGKIPKWVIIIAVFIIVAAIISSAAGNIEKEKENFKYNVTNEYTDSIGVHYIEGTVTNGNDKEYSYLQIEFICYDKDGNNLGTALDNTNNIKANESWKFKAMLMSTNGEADHCDYKEVTGW